MLLTHYTFSVPDNAPWRIGHVAHSGVGQVTDLLPRLRPTQDAPERPQPTR